MKTLTQKEVKEILHKHGMWWRDEEGGERADLQGADLRGAYLQGAYLQGAYLQGADLRGADLRVAYGQNRWVKSLSTDIWDVVYTHDRMQIGCESHLLTEWWGYDDERISQMDDKALEFWGKWKPILQQIIQIAPAFPTKEEATT